MGEQLAGVKLPPEINRPTLPTFKPTAPPLKTVAGGIIRRMAINKTARLVTAKANWICQPLPDPKPPETIGHELELLRREVHTLNDRLAQVGQKLKEARAEVTASRRESEKQRAQIELLTQSLDYANAMLEEVKRTFNPL